MRTPDHLTKKQLVSYSEGSLRKDEAETLGQHLMSCAVCREALPTPSPSRLLTVLIGEDYRHVVAANIDEKIHTSFSGFPSLVRTPSVLAWSSGAILVVLSFSILIWMNSNYDQPDMAAIDPAQAEKIEVVFDSEPKTSEIIDRPRNIKSEKAKIKKPSKTRQTRKRPIKTKDIRKKTSAKTANAPESKTSLIRGGTSQPECDETEINGNIKTKGKSLVLQWKKVPKALKYHLFVSDEDEILIDEYETKDGTSYVLRKSLEAGKTYKWKILVTLENGEMVFGKAQKFTAKEKNVETFDRKEISSIRCSETN